MGKATNTFTDNQLGITQFPAVAQAIINASGLPTTYLSARTAGTDLAAVSSFKAADCLPCSITANVRQSGCLGNSAQANARNYFTLAVDRR